MTSRNILLGVVAAILLVAAVALPFWNSWRNRPSIVTATVLIEPKTSIDFSSTQPEPASPEYLTTVEFRRAILNHPRVRDLAVVKQQEDPESWLRERLEVKPDQDEPNIIYFDLAGYQRFESLSEMVVIVDAATEILKDYCASNDLFFDILTRPVVPTR